MSLETVKVKREGGRGFRLINRKDFDPKKHTMLEGEKPKSETPAQRIAREESELADARRTAEGNRGQVDGSGNIADGKNPSGTYSEPTPTDVRFPDKLATEFENNLGQSVNKSAAGLREEQGLPDAPGGIKPAEAAAIDPTISGQGKTREEIRAIEIPADWDKREDKDIVALVVALTGKEPKTLEEAQAAIDGELKLRAQEDAPKA
jgi:hypothetical protein